MANIIMAEAPIALAYEVHEDHAVVYPLTPCCHASGKGCDGYTGCRACYQEVSPLFGDCWEHDGRHPLLRHDFKWANGSYDGWATYWALLLDEGVGNIKADELVTEAKRQIAEVRGA